MRVPSNKRVAGLPARMRGDAVALLSVDGPLFRSLRSLGKRVPLAWSPAAESVLLPSAAARLATGIPAGHVAKAKNGRHCVWTRHAIRSRTSRPAPWETDSISSAASATVAVTGAARRICTPSSGRSCPCMARSTCSGETENRAEDFGD